MADIFSKSKRSALMRRVKAKNTGPEIIVRKELRSQGLSDYKLHPKELPGRPDIYFPSEKLALFIHGCFWHRCHYCKKSAPKTHKTFWTKKFARNVSRDKRNRRQLKKLGITPVVLWECRIKKDVKNLVNGLKRNMNKTYNPDTELAKGATLQATSYDKTQKAKVVAGKVTVGGKAGIVEFSGIATGRTDSSINGTIGIWLSIFRFMRPDGTINHVAGWNIMLPLKAKQTAAVTAKAFAKTINSGTRPYKATTSGTKLKIVYTEKQP